jgi:hypothetical protein
MANDLVCDLELDQEQTWADTMQIDSFDEQLDSIRSFLGFNYLVST